MGAAGSRRPRQDGKNRASKRLKLGRNHPPPCSSYFILSLRGDKVKVVNAEAEELKMLAVLLRRHCHVVKEGWDRHLTYSYKVKVDGRHTMIQIVADTLLSLYQVGVVD